MLRRWSAVVLYAVFVPLSFGIELGYGAWNDHALLLTAATALLVVQATVCAIWGDGMPPWGWTLLVVALPVSYVLYAAANADAAAALVAVLIVPTGWVALFLGWRLVLLSIVLNVLAVASLLVIDTITAAGWSSWRSTAP